MSTRPCGAGAAKAVRSFAAAMGIARPTRVIVRGGRLFEPMHVMSSGTPVAPIVVSQYPGETVRLTRVDSRSRGEVYRPVWLDEASHVVIAGFTVADSVGFGRITGGGNNRAEDFRFEGTRLGLGSESKRGGLYITHSAGNVVRGNLFQSGTDSLTLVASDRNLIEGNRFVDAGHTTLALKCSNYKIVRGNTFANRVQKTVEIYDCSKSTMAWHGNGRFRTDTPRYGETRRNLVEGNTFTMTGRNERADSAPLMPTASSTPVRMAFCVAMYSRASPGRLSACRCTPMRPRKTAAIASITTS